jgi:hypothetical protein
MRSKGRVIEIVGEGSDDVRWLDFISANAASGGEGSTSITLREEPRAIEVWEEFLHGTQVKCGINVGTSDRAETIRAEIHVKEFMIAHRRLIGITAADVEVLKALLAGH